MIPESVADIGVTQSNEKMIRGYFQVSGVTHLQVYWVTTSQYSLLHLIWVIQMKMDCITIRSQEEQLESL